MENHLKCYQYPWIFPTFYHVSSPLGNVLKQLGLTLFFLLFLSHSNNLLAQTPSPTPTAQAEVLPSPTPSPAPMPTPSAVPKAVRRVQENKPIVQILPTEKSGHDLEDLEILEKEQNYLEYLRHAMDVRPKVRGRAWKEMTSKMADLYLKQLLQEGKVSKTDFEYMEELFTWPTLREDIFFQERRIQVGLSYLKACPYQAATPTGVTANPRTCIDSLWRFVQKTPGFSNAQRANSSGGARGLGDPRFGVELGKVLIQLDLEKEESPWRLFEPAVKSELAEFYCKDPLVKKELLLKLRDIQLGEGSEREKNQKLTTVVHASCWKALIPELKKALMLSDLTTQELAYALLKLRKALSTADTDVYHTIYLLGGPIVGDLFNESWNTLKALGQSHSRRERVLEVLQKMDPMPDKVFALYDVEKKRVLVDFFAQNFPEYVDTYAKTCLDFLSGARSFPQGNPTVHCRDFFKLGPPHKNWPAAGLRERYDQLQAKLNPK